MVSSNSSASAQRDLELEVSELYELYSAPLLRYAASFDLPGEAARDGVQEAFLRYFVERRYGRLIEYPRAWLFHVLRNYLLEQLSRASSKCEVPAEEAHQVASNHYDPEALMRRAELAKELTGRLTARELDCLRLRVAGLQYSEIADALEIRSGTVGALVARAHSKLREAAGPSASSQVETAGAVDLLFHPGDAYSS